MAINWGVQTKLLTMREAAQILNVEEKTIRRWCDQGIFNAYKLLPFAGGYIPEVDVRFLGSHMRGNHSDFNSRF